MHITFNPDQIRLLELFISPSYLGDLRDKWSQMIDHVESCLAAYMSNLPPNYRSKPLPEQPDIFWGHRVMPNFRDTLESLNRGLILLTHEDFAGLSSAHGPRSDGKGQTDFWAGWMSNDDEKMYENLLYTAVGMANNIVLTEGAYWNFLDPSKHVRDLHRSLNTFANRRYNINRSVFVRSGEATKASGIYVPDCDHACPQFLNNSRHSSPLAQVHVSSKDLLHPITREKYDEQMIFEEKDCVWYLVESSDGGISDSMEQESSESLCVSGGESCPKTGFYFTPAKLNSRTWLEERSIMPSFDSDYGRTIWQWDANQS